jgi:hypothetical protein
VISPSQDRYLTQKQNTHKETSMPRVGFELTIPAFERGKTVHALDRAATVIGIYCEELTQIKIYNATATELSTWRHPFHTHFTADKLFKTTRSNSHIIIQLSLPATQHISSLLSPFRGLFYSVSVYISGFSTCGAWETLLLKNGGHTYFFRRQIIDNKN